MKQFLFLILLLSVKSAFSQERDMIYLADGTKIPGKISEIGADKIQFTNTANPTAPAFSRPTSDLQIAFNAAGDYLVFSNASPLADKEKSDFINAASKPHTIDILIDSTGAVVPVNISSESELSISAYNATQLVKYSKSGILVLIRKNGSHDLYSGIKPALPFLISDKSKINDLLANPPALAKGDESTKAAGHAEGDYIEPDVVLFGNKAIAKTTEFTGYLTSIESVNTNRAAATKSIDLACDLFLKQGEDSRVEVSNTNSTVINKYKVRDYLDRLMIKAGQFQKVNIEFADINYATKFEKGADGNYYGTVTFVQKFQGFVDGNLVYGDQTKRSVVIVLKHYDKQVNGETVSGWDVFLDDIGVFETRKL